jgi:hypothetical protein
MSSGGANPISGVIYGKGSQIAGYLYADGSKAGCDLSFSGAMELEPDRPECKEWTGQASTKRLPRLECETTEEGECGALP